LLIFQLFADGNSANPDLNPVLRSAIDEALKKSMPQASIQNILKKGASAGELKKHLLEIKALNKVFMVVLIYTENITGVKMNVSTILRKNAAIWSETRHLFVDKGLVQANASARHSEGTDSLEEVCTEDAIECGAEDVEVADEPTKIVNVNLLQDIYEKGASNLSHPFFIVLL
jgi:transcriptional/translational regulatory protein YebC/TACO1